MYKEQGPLIGHKEHLDLGVWNKDFDQPYKFSKESLKTYRISDILLFPEPSDALEVSVNRLIN